MVATRSSSSQQAQHTDHNGDLAPLPIDPITNSPSGRRAPKPTQNGTLYAWAHVPSQVTLAWLFISLPLVCWDIGYTQNRPWSMEGGALYWPLYVPYKLYGQIDYVYGWPSLDAKRGFCAAQGFMNMVETAMYIWYLWTMKKNNWRAGGKDGAKAVVVGFSAAVMTLSKTVLYWANEYFESFANIGHNRAIDLLFLWIIPNGAWLVGSTWMIFEMGSQILEGLEIAGEHTKHQ